MELLLPAAVLLAGAIILAIALRRGQPLSGDVSTGALNAKLDLLDAETRRLHERMARLEVVPQALTALQLQTNQLAARITPIETVSNTVAALRLETSKVTERLQQFDPVTKTLDDVRSTVTILSASVDAKQRQDAATAESIRRLEMVIAGTQSKGAAGENIVEAVLAALPSEWQVRDFRVQNQTVEFGLRLPTGLVVPIDSKWGGTDLLQKFSATQDPEEQASLKKQIEAGVLARAKEVHKYIDPELTSDFGVAAVPDAVYDLSLAVTPRSFSDHRVVIVSYSLLVPYLLMIVQTALRSSASIDMQKLATHLVALETNLSELAKEIEGRLSRTATQLDNSRNTLRSVVGKARSNIGSIRAIGEATGTMQLPPAEDEQPPETFEDDAAGA